MMTEQPWLADVPAAARLDLGLAAGLMALATAAAATKVEVVGVSAALPFLLLTLVPILRALRRRVAATPGPVRFEALGFSAAYPNEEAARPEIYDAICVARKRVVLVGVNHQSYLSNDHFRDAVAEFLRKRGTRLDVYFLDPEGTAAGDRAEREGRDVPTFLNNIRAQIAALRQLADELGASRQVAVLLYDRAPRWRILAIDPDGPRARSRAFVAYYPEASGGKESGMVRMHPTDGASSFFEAFLAELSCVHESAIATRTASAPTPIP